jgi:hypothetical protein
MERGLRSLPLENTDWTGNGKNYFLGIGIDDYLHWDRLNNAVKDVNDFISVLTTQYQFELHDIHTLYNSQATEGNIYNKIRELKRNIQAEDNLIVYYSGHGHYDEEFDEGYWIPVDAQRGSEDRYISNANIIKRINAIETHHTLMIVDSCFSGTLVVKKRSGLTDERFKSRRILASGRQETVADGQAGENSPFAAGIITYLKKNTEKAINTTALVQYVKDYVETRSRQTPVEGRIQNSADEGGEFVFHLKLDEESLWKNVLSEDKVDAYSNYLDYYPSGIFANQANRRILELKEDDIWQSARIKDSELAYENYLKKYAPNGKYVTEAKACLQKLQATHEERRAALDEMAKKRDERDHIRKQYDGLVAEAESLFVSKQLAEARERYREAQRYFLPGFIPDTDYIEEQINFCSNGLTFLNYYENGRRAMDNRNYRLALQYFGEALKVDDNPKVEDLISYCRLKLEETTRPSRPAPSTDRGNIGLMEEEEVKAAPQQPIVAQPRKPRPKKKSSLRIPLIVVGAVIVLYFIAVAVVSSGIFDEPYTPSSSYNSYEPVEDPDIQGTSTVPAPTPSTPSYAQLILGSWELSDFYSDDPNADALMQMWKGMQAVYTFYNNGTVNISSNFAVNNYYYSIVEGQLSIPGAVQTASIDQLDRNMLIFTAYFYDNSYNYAVTFEFNKMD